MRSETCIGVGVQTKDRLQNTETLKDSQLMFYFKEPRLGHETRPRVNLKLAQNLISSSEEEYKGDQLGMSLKNTSLPTPLISQLFLKKLLFFIRKSLIGSAALVIQ